MQLKASVMNLQPPLREGARGRQPGGKFKITKTLIKTIPFLSLPNSTSFLKVNQDLGEL